MQGKRLDDQVQAGGFGQPDEHGQAEEERQAAGKGAEQPVLEPSGPLSKALGQVAGQPTFAVADHQQAADQAAGDGQAHDESRQEPFGDGGAEADQAAHHQQAHQHQKVERPLAEDRPQPFRSGDVRLLTEQVRPIEIPHLRREDAVREPGQDHDVKQLTEVFGFTGVAQQ